MCVLVRLSVFGAALALSGCATMELPDVLDRVVTPKGAEPAVPVKAAVPTGGELSQSGPLAGITVAGAPDECLLPEATAARGTVASATLANCEAIAKSPDPGNYPGFTTVTVTNAAPPTDLAERDAIAAFLATPAGARSLARDPSQPVTVHDTRVTSAAVYADVSDPAVASGVAPRHWRAFVGINGKMVTVARYAPLANPSASSNAAIRAAVQHIIDAN